MFYRSLGIALIGVGLWAQEAPPPPPPPPGAAQNPLADRMRDMAAQLNLTDDQKKKSAPILLAQGPKLKALRDDTSMSQGDKLKKLIEIRDDSDSKVRAVLTPDQQAKFDKIRAEQKRQTAEQLRNQRQQ